MSETDNQDLSTLKLPELRKIAAGKGLKGVSALRKGELITAITTGQVPAKAQKAAQAAAVAEEAPRGGGEREPQEKTARDSEQSGEQPRGRGRRSNREDNRSHQAEGERAQQSSRPDKTDNPERSEKADNAENSDRDSDDRRDERRQERGNDREEREGRGRRGRRNRRNRRGRDRDRDRGERNERGNEQDSAPEELQDVAGILEVVDNNAAFVRSTGYRTSSADVFVNNQLVKRFGLRSGDAITGQVKMNAGGHTHGNGRNRRKYNQLTRVDTVNGQHPEESRKRPEFHRLTPLYPNQRLRLETEPNILTTRVIDLVMPIGKGQRALIVSPPKAGKTTILQNVANAIATNNPECYLMVVLVDERPEEVTDMQRSVKGEVIASTFDRPPSEHTAVAELAIERAKRLVEMGKDVVVLFDSITRLGRAYNNSSPASGRILSGGVDSNALYPPKRFLGAARNIENGGSLTIIATAMVETGSAGDTVIFEEFKGTGNAELKLDRKIAERRVFPAVDVNPSGTRKDELLMPTDEFRVMHKLRRILAALDSQAAIDLLIKQLKKTKSNGEFLMQVASSAPMAAGKDVEEYL